MGLRQVVVRCCLNHELSRALRYQLRWQDHRQLTRVVRAVLRCQSGKSRCLLTASPGTAPHRPPQRPGRCRCRARAGHPGPLGHSTAQKGHHLQAHRMCLALNVTCLYQPHMVAGITNHSSEVASWGSSFLMSHFSMRMYIHCFCVCQHLQNVRPGSTTKRAYDCPGKY